MEYGDVVWSLMLILHLCTGQPARRLVEDGDVKQTFNPVSGKQTFNPVAGRQTFKAVTGGKDFYPVTGRQSFKPITGG